MHVGLIIYGTLDTVSGGFRYDSELVDCLSARGAKVTVFSQPWRPYAARLLDNFDRAMIRAVQRTSLDLLLQDELNHASLIALNRRRHKAPKVAVVHHLRSSERHPDPLRAFYRRVERRYLDGVDAFLCNSQTTAGTVQALSPRPRPVAVAEPGKRRVESTLNRDALDERAAERPRRLLFVGNVVPRKGLRTLLSALEGIESDQWTVDVVGDLGVDRRYALACRQQAEALSHCRVRFHGRVGDAALDAAYRRAHVLCVPSEYEGYGMVYAEALQYGVPVIAARAGAAREFIEDEVTGFLVSAGSTAEVASALNRLEDSRRLAQMSHRALRRSADLPTWPETMNRAVDFLERIVVTQ